MLVAQDLSRILISDSQNLLKVFNATNGELLRKIQLGKAGPTSEDLVLNSDASHIIMETDYASTDSLVEVWDINAARLLYQFHIPDSGFYITFDADGRRIITYRGNNDARLIRWWDPATGLETREMDAQNGALKGVIFSPDKKYILSWGEDQTLKIREVTSGQLVRTLTPPAQINTVMISPDQHYIAVGLSTSQTAIYDFENGDEIVTLPGSSINFLPEGKAVLNVMPDDPTVYSFLLDNNAFVHLACKRLEQISLEANGLPAPALNICQQAASNP